MPIILCGMIRLSALFSYFHRCPYELHLLEQNKVKTQRYTSRRTPLTRLICWCVTWWLATRDPDRRQPWCHQKRWRVNIFACGFVYFGWVPPGSQARTTAPSNTFTYVQNQIGNIPSDVHNQIFCMFVFHWVCVCEMLHKTEIHRLNKNVWQSTIMALNGKPFISCQKKRKMPHHTGPSDWEQARQTTAHSWKSVSQVAQTLIGDS